MKKRTLLNHEALAWLAGALLNAYGQLILLTSRIAVQRDPATTRLVLEQGGPVIYALWHCHVFFMPMLRLSSGRPVAVLLSAHRDAQIVGVAARMRGVQLVAGSSTRGGVRAYLQLIQMLRAGRSVCITPDGPRGPAHRVKPGVVHLARQSGCAVVPMGLAVTRQRRLRSWDRTLLPLPFCRVVLTLGPPLWLPPAQDPRTLGLQAQQVEAALETASQQAIRALSVRAL
ncbi:lysophospholipid acyltransferase family protein [Cyanobium sp. NIES-981]|uniref:lysophospholipid acyltransferase family protein n=1 Tax=Cyanobium sp. NIES-981 TaxID=1851505 RepID=UPI0007DD3C19|nr:lysophospholipid acyltransferase family protein [Cyanobium sp. NIES-981]SBO43718.1 3-Deoxy-D-manno-octulosonic-acid transferase [Cyanobium sp. NIES-981]